MSDADELVERIVSESGRARGDVLSQMAERKERTHGLLSDYGAAYAVAKELGIGRTTLWRKLKELGIEEVYR